MCLKPCKYMGLLVFQQCMGVKICLQFDKVTSVPQDWCVDLTDMLQFGLFDKLCMCPLMLCDWR